MIEAALDGRWPQPAISGEAATIAWWMTEASAHSGYVLPSRPTFALLRGSSLEDEPFRVETHQHT
jgi:hypothetical protein